MTPDTHCSSMVRTMSTAFINSKSRALTMSETSDDHPGWRADPKAEFSRLLKATDQYDYLSKTPHLHMAFIFKTVIDNLQDISNPSQKWREMPREYSLRFKNPKDPSRLLVSGSVAEGISLPESMEEREYRKFTRVCPDVDIMVVNANLSVQNKSENSGANLMFDPSCSHHGYTRLEVVSDLHDPSLEVEKSGRNCYLSSEGFLCTTDLEMLPDDVGRQELGVKTESSKIRQGPAVTCEGSLFTCDNSMNRETMVDTVPAIKTTWPDVGKEWLERKRHGAWPSADLVQSLAAGGCHVVPVSHAHSTHPSLEFRLSFSRTEVLLVHSLTPFQRSCYRLFKVICSAGISPNKVIATYFLKTTFFWVCQETADHFWKTANVSYIILVLLDKLQCFLANQFLPNFFVPKNNMIDHILPEKLKMAEKSLMQIRTDPVKYLFMFSRSHLFRRGGFPWHKAFIPVVTNIAKYIQSKQINDTASAFQKSLEECAHCQVEGYCFSEALGNYNALFDIKELTENVCVPYRLAYASDSCLFLLHDRDEGWLFTMVNKLISFHNHMLDAASTPEEQATLHYRIGLLYLLLSQLPNPKYPPEFLKILETIKKLRPDIYEAEFMKHRVEHLTKAQTSFQEASSLWNAIKGEGGVCLHADAALKLPSPTEITLRAAQAFLLQGNPDEAEACLTEVIQESEACLTEVIQEATSREDVIAIRSFEKCMYEVDSLTKFILDSRQETGRGLEDRDHLRPWHTAAESGVSGGEDPQSAANPLTQMMTLSEDGASFSQILQEHFITQVPCRVVAYYLLILVHLLKGQSAPQKDVMVLGQICGVEAELGNTAETGNAKCVTDAASRCLYRDCCWMVQKLK